MHFSSPIRIGTSEFTLTHFVAVSCDIYRRDSIFENVFSLCSVLFDDDGEKEHEFVYDISRSKKEAVSIAELLCRERVLPSDTVCMLENILG